MLIFNRFVLSRFGHGNKSRKHRAVYFHCNSKSDLDALAPIIQFLSTLQQSITLEISPFLNNSASLHHLLSVAGDLKVRELKQLHHSSPFLDNYKFAIQPRIRPTDTSNATHVFGPTSLSISERLISRLRNLRTVMFAHGVPFWTGDDFSETLRRMSNEGQTPDFRPRNSFDLVCVSHLDQKKRHERWGVGESKLRVTGFPSINSDWIRSKSDWIRSKQVELEKKRGSFCDSGSNWTESAVFFVWARREYTRQHEWESQIYTLQELEKNRVRTSIGIHPTDPDRETVLSMIKGYDFVLPMEGSDVFHRFGDYKIIAGPNSTLAAHALARGLPYWLLKFVDPNATSLSEIEGAREVHDISTFVQEAKIVCSGGAVPKKRASKMNISRFLNSENALLLCFEAVIGAEEDSNQRK